MFDSKDGFTRKEILQALLAATVVSLLLIYLSMPSLEVRAPNELVTSAKPKWPSWLPSSARSLLSLSKDVPSGPSLSIFCAPKPYSDDPDDPQRRALLSWLRLSPPPKVVLLGSDLSFYALADEFPGRVEVEPNIDYNFLGVPLYHSMIARAQAAETDISMVINGDIILLNDIMLAIEKVQSKFDQWVLTAARWDAPQDFPFSFEPLVLAKSDKSPAELEKEVIEYTREHGVLHTYGGVDVWVWNNSPVPLFEGSMPPFAFARAKYDNWITHEISHSGLRQMVDASDAITTIHVKHACGHTSGAAEGANDVGSCWSTRTQSTWEVFANIHMAFNYGNYTNQMGSALHVPWRLSSCHEPSTGNICLQRRLRPGNCSCEYSAMVRHSLSDPKLDERKWMCGTVSSASAKDFVIEAVATEKSPPGLPHTMEQILPQVAKEVDGEKVVTLVAVTAGYKDVLMSFVCRMRMLGLADNLVVAALDEELYRFAFTQGLPVYYAYASTGIKSEDIANCTYGNPCFLQVTKCKSRAVLGVLKAGYSVLWTDVDIVWFKDPLKELMAFGPGTLPIQSNEPNASKPAHGRWRINSGFYFARPDNLTIQGFEAVIKHAIQHVNDTEQPSFYKVLCGRKMEYITPFKEECTWSNGLRVIFLDRAVYPNGAVYNLWEQENVTQACLDKGCAILHNNWITGKEAKVQRLKANGYWYYDPERRLCMWPWHNRLPPYVAPQGSFNNSVASA